MRTVADLHPEALLDRDARGELSASERTRLGAHLARCAACRFERQLRLDFAGDLESDVTPSSVERLTLAGTSTPRPAVVKSPTVTPIAALPAPATMRPARRRVTRATWLLAAAAVFAVSVAGATGAGQRAISRILGAPGEAAPSDEQASASHVAAKRVPRHRAAPAPTVIPDTPRAAPTSVDVLVPSAPPSPSDLPAPRRASSSEGAASLFEAATDARRRGDYARAIGLQHELESRYPRSRESHVSRATMGRLLLDRGDPAGALASFESYLATGSGELGEEAMVGRATALERLGRTAQAAGAWQALLAAYPETPFAAHARSRLGSLSVR